MINMRISVVVLCNIVNNRAV